MSHRPSGCRPNTIVSISRSVSSPASVRSRLSMEWISQHGGIAEHLQAHDPRLDRVRDRKVSHPFRPRVQPARYSASEPNNRPPSTIVASSAKLPNLSRPSRKALTSRCTPRAPPSPLPTSDSTSGRYRQYLHAPVSVPASHDGLARWGAWQVRACEAADDTRVDAGWLERPGVRLSGLGPLASERVKKRLWDAPVFVDVP